MKAVKEDYSEQEKFQTKEIFAEPIAHETEPAFAPISSTPSRNWLAGKWRLFVVFGVCAVIVAGGKYLISSVGRHNAKTPVATSPSQVRTINTTGIVVAKELLTILPQATDVQIKQVLVREGDRVKAGQVMAVFDDSVVQAQVDQAKGQLKSAEAIVLQKQAAVRQAQAQLSREKADLVKAQAGLGKEKADLVKAQAELGRDKANLAKAKSERDRYQILASRGAISLQELDTRATDAAAFEEQVRSAQAEVGSVQAEVSQAQAEIGSLRAEVNAAGANVASAQAELNSVQANVSSSKAQIQQLQTQRERTLLRAPANGLVIERIAQVGDVTSFDRKLFSLVRDSSFQLQTMLEEYQLSGVHIGTPVQVTSDSDKRIRLRGTVRKIAPVFDSQTHQPVIRIDLPPSTLVHSGMVLRVAMASNNQADKQKFTGAVLPKYP